MALHLHNLGGVLCKQGEVERGITTYREALALRERNEGPSHPDTATTLQALGNQLGELGRTDEAIPMLERALEIRREAKADPYLRASSAYTLGKLREQVGERTEGIALVREARELLTEIQPRHAKFLAEVDAWLAEHGAAPEG